LVSVDVLILDGNIRKLLGKDKMAAKLRRSEATVGGLIRKLDKEHQGKVKEAISKPNVFILVNGQDMEFLSNMNTELSDGDRVVIIPLVAGG
jgi:MoaD family protein